jgi:hypothetical protein
MTANAPSARQRSRFFVDRRLQGDIVKRILLHWLTFVLVGTVLAMTLRWLTHPTEPLSQQLRGMFADFGPYLVALLALLPMFVLDTIKLTNRFAGPYVRFRRHIRALIANESPGPIKFRDGDFWRETEDDLNALLKAAGMPRVGNEEGAASKPAVAGSTGGAA